MDPKKKNIVFAVTMIIVAGLAATFVGCDIINSIKDSLSKSKEKKTVQTIIPSTPSQEITSQPSKSPSPAMTPNTLARVGNWAITIEQFNDRLAALKEVMPEYDIQNLDNKKAVLEELTRQQLLVEEAEQTGLAQDKNVLAAMEEFRRTLLVRELAAKLTKDLTVTDDEMKAFYDQNKDVLVSPLEWQVSEIVVQDQAKANELLIEVLKGTDFAELAKQNSFGKTANQGGDLGFLTQPPFPEMASAIASLGKGDVSSVFKGPEGYYIVKVADKKGGEPIAFETIKEEIRQNQLLNKQQQVILSHIAELEKTYPVEIKEDLLGSKTNVAPAPEVKQEENK